MQAKKYRYLVIFYLYNHFRSIMKRNQTNMKHVHFALEATDTIQDENIGNSKLSASTTLHNRNTPFENLCTYEDSSPTNNETNNKSASLKKKRANKNGKRIRSLTKSVVLLSSNVKCNALNKHSFRNQTSPVTDQLYLSTNISATWMQFDPSVPMFNDQLRSAIRTIDRRRQRSRSPANAAVRTQYLKRSDGKR